MVQSLEVTNLADVDEWPPGADLIPKERYLSREFAELEADRLWPRVWQVACREEEIPNVGDYLEYTIADQSIIVVRDQPDRLRAYFNACRHRGNMLKQGCGNAKEIRCRYHGWRWHLDGTIKEVVDAYDFNPESVSAEKLCLPECLVDTWGGFVFINMDPEAESLQSFLGPAVLDRLGRYGWEDMRFTRYRTTVVRANWKTALDAFNDHNHLQATHPQALLFTDDVNWTYETHGRHTAMVPIPGAGGRMSPRLGDFPAATTRPAPGHDRRAGRVRLRRSRRGGEHEAGAADHGGIDPGRHVAVELHRHAPPAGSGHEGHRRRSLQRR